MPPTFRRGVEIAEIAIDNSDIVDVIASFLTIDEADASLKGVNKAGFKAYKRMCDNRSPMDALNDLWRMVVSGARPVDANKLVLPNHIFSFYLPEDYPSYQHIGRHDATGKLVRQLIGRMGVYFSKGGGGGLVVYDDVEARYPVKIPMKRLLDISAEYVAASIRSVELATADITKDITLPVLMVALRSQLPAGFTHAAALVPGARYKVIYLSQANVRAPGRFHQARRDGLHGRRDRRGAVAVRQPPRVPLGQPRRRGHAADARLPKAGPGAMRLSVHMNAFVVTRDATYSPLPPGV